MNLSTYIKDVDGEVHIHFFICFLKYPAVSCILI